MEREITNVEVGIDIEKKNDDPSRRSAPSSSRWRPAGARGFASSKWRWRSIRTSCRHSARCWFISMYRHQLLLFDSKNRRSTGNQRPDIIRHRRWAKRGVFRRNHEHH